MRIQSRNIKSFLKNPNQDICFILVYGQDFHSVNDYTARLFKSYSIQINDPFQFQKINTSDIISNNEIFFDSVYAQSLLGRKQGIHITHVTDRFTTILKSYLDRINPDTLIIATADALSRNRSSLVKLCETSQKCASLPIYEDNTSDRKSLISNILKNYNLEIKPDALNWATTILEGDHGILKNEIQKLTLYAQNQKILTLEDVQHVLNGQTNTILDDLAFYAASGNIDLLEISLEKAEMEEISDVGIIRAVITHFIRLFIVKQTIQNGQTFDYAIKNLKPPVFFKRINIFKTQIEFWSLLQIRHRLLELARIESILKKSNMSHTCILQRSLFQTAIIAAKIRSNTKI